VPQGGFEDAEGALEVELWNLLKFEESKPKGPAGRAAAAMLGAEKISEYLFDRPPDELERAGNPIEDVERRIRGTALDLAEKLGAHSRPLRKIFLRVASRFPECAHAPAEECCTSFRRDTAGIV
jgi:hypothetical protein